MRNGSVSQLKPVSDRFVASIVADASPFGGEALARITLLEHVPGGAQPERVAALRAPRLGRPPPGEGVEMAPGRSFGDEFLQEERGGARARQRRLGHVAD